METQLANQIARALVLDGVCKLTQDQIVEALLPVYVDGFRFGGVARERTSPGKVSRLTIFATAADGVYRAFSGHSVLYDQIVLFASEDGARWTKWIVYDGGRGAVDYPVNMRTVPLTFTAITEDTLYFYSTSAAKSIEISTDGGKTWTAKNSSSSGLGTLLAELGPGESVMVRGNNSSYRNYQLQGSANQNARMAISGNIMSLLDAENFADLDAVPSQAFDSLFSTAITFVSAEKLVLPATTLGSGCYAYMFDGCTGLTVAPELPATTLAGSCYQYMFQNCTALAESPVLPAKSLANFCYQNMFAGCSTLSKVTCLAEDISAYSSHDAWLNNVAAAGTFVKPVGVTWPAGGSGIPTGWTVEEV